MLDLIKSLFLGTSVMVTNAPIEIGTGEHTFKTTDTLDVVNSGAHLRIRMSNMLIDNDPLSGLKIIEDKYPQGCIKAILGTTDEVTLSVTQYGISEGSANISIYKMGGIDPDIEFDTFIISSCKAMEIESIYWVNVGK